MMEQSQRLATLPPPPYYCVVFTSLRAAGNDQDNQDYAVMAQRMLELARQQEGFLGVESVRDSQGLGITVSYWRDLEAIRVWHAVEEHRQAQALGRSQWYERFALRVSRVERHYDFAREA